MGEEEKKTEEKKGDEKKPEEKKEGEKKEEEKKEEKTEEVKEPEEIVLKVFMHCEGCAKKVKRCLKGFPGVEDVLTDCKTHNVIVKGKTAAQDPLKVLGRIQRKSHRKVELISPIPKPPTEVVEEVKEEPKPEEKKEEPVAITVTLKVHMHCEACSQEIRKRILKMKGIESVEPDLKSSQVTVKGVFEVPNLVDYVYKRTGKHAEVVKEPEKKDEKSKDEKGDKKPEETAEEKKKEETEKKDTKAEESAAPKSEEETKIEVKKNEYFYYYPTLPPKYEYVYAPQIFSDENPNACTVM